MNKKILSITLAAIMAFSATALAAPNKDSEYEQTAIEEAAESNDEPELVATLTENEDGETIGLFDTEGYNELTPDVWFTGNAIMPDVELFAGGVKLTKGTDYNLSYSNNTNVGQATITISFIGNYTGTRTVNFNIVANALDNSNITISNVEERYTYTGSAITPEPTIASNTTGETLTKNKDYTLSYENNTGNGTATINITFTGNYSGSASTTFQIGAKEVDVENLLISSIADQPFTGSEITPTPTVKYGSQTYVAGDSASTTADFYYTYENNVRAGTATVNIIFINNYSGSTSRTFKIVASEVTDTTPTVGTPDSSNPTGVYMAEAVANRTYTGSAHTPQVTLYYGNGTQLIEGTDYDLSYSNNINAGTATITITYKHDLSGTQTVTFTIDPKDVTDDMSITFSAIGDQTYTAQEITPEPEVRDTSR